MPCCAQDSAAEPINATQQVTITLRNGSLTASIRKEFSCIEKNRRIVGLTAQAVANTPTPVTASWDPDTNCVQVEAEVPATLRYCVQIPEFSGFFPRFRESCATEPFNVVVNLTVQVQIPRSQFKVYTHYNSDPASLGSASEAAVNLNIAVARAGFQTFSTDRELYVCTRPAYSGKRLVTFYYNEDLEAAKIVTLIANRWLQGSHIGGSSFEASNQADLPKKEPRGSISLELCYGTG